MDEPPKFLKYNIAGNCNAGRKVLRGTVEVEMCEDGTIAFTNVVVNEVSSHYTADSFYLVVVNLATDQVEPLIIPNVIVRARKPIRGRGRR